MMEEQEEDFLVNPPRRRRRMSLRRNAWFGARAGHRRAALKGWRRKARRNPPKKARRARKASRRLGAPFLKSRRHRISVYATGPRVWRRSPRSRSKRRHITINPYMTVAGANPRRRGPRRLRRNPVGGPFDLMQNLPYMVTGALSATSLVIVPPMLPAAMQTPLMRFGAQAALAIGGGMLVGQFVGKTHGTVWTITGGAVIIADLIKTYVVPMIPGLSEYEVSAYENSGYDVGEQDQIEAFPAVDVSSFSAFPMGSGAY